VWIGQVWVSCHCDGREEIHRLRENLVRLARAGRITERVKDTSLYVLSIVNSLNLVHSLPITYDNPEALHHCFV
jgi:hypothetical protein